MKIAFIVYFALVLILIIRREIRKRSGIQVHSWKKIGRMLLNGGLITLAIGLLIEFFIK